METHDTETPHSAGQQIWNADNYAHHGRFVANLAGDVVALLAPEPGEHILDVGCGDGALTAALAGTGAHLTGIDSSASMVEAARARGLDVLHRSAADLALEATLHGRFHAVFSNAALHWLPAAQQPAALAGIARTLRPGGRFVAEMGGQGNIAAIRTALRAALQPFDLDAEALAESFFPSPALYTELLKATGLRVQSIALVPRPTPLPDGSGGMLRWLTTFRNGVLDAVPPAHRDAVLASVQDLLRPILFDPGSSTRPPLWTADYVRLRFHALLA